MVEIVELKLRSDLNGQYAILMRYDDKKQRWQAFELVGRSLRRTWALHMKMFEEVRSEPNFVCVRPSNMRLVSSMSLQKTLAGGGSETHRLNFAMSQLLLICLDASCPSIVSPSTTLAYLRAAASRGNSDAKCMVAFAGLHVEAFKKDALESECMALLKSAAQQGCGLAIFKLGLRAEQERDFIEMESIMDKYKPNDRPLKHHGTM